MLSIGMKTNARFGALFGAVSISLLLGFAGGSAAVAAENVSSSEAGEAANAVLANADAGNFAEEVDDVADADAETADGVAESSAAVVDGMGASGVQGPAVSQGTLDSADESSLAATNGWVSQNGNLYWYDDGVMAASKEVYDPETNAWYWFDADGTMARDKDVYLPAGNKWVRYDENGHMRKGEDCRYGGWYYFDSVTGAMAKGFVLVPDQAKWVYYDEITGQMLYGEQVINGGWYYLNEVTGAVTYGFHYFDYASKWVYYDTVTGIMQTGEVYVRDGEPGWCYFDDVTGALYYGWKWVESSGGKLVYYDGTTGRMAFGTTSINGVSLTFDSVTGALSASVSPLQLGFGMDTFAWLQGVDSMYFDPSLSTSSLLQYANLRVGKNTVTAAQIDAFIESSSSGRSGTLRGHGQDVLDAANEYGIDAVYLLAHAIIESGWGTSSLSAGEYWEEHTFDGATYPAGNYFNFFGWGAFDDSAYSSGMNYAQINGWDSVRDALMGGAEVISEGYIDSGRSLSGISDASQNTLYEMRWDPEYTIATGEKSYHQYATAPTWAQSIASVMEEFYTVNGTAPNYEYVFPAFE